MNEPIGAKKPPEVKPWVRRGIEGRALCAFQPSSTTANHRQRRAAPARGKERKPSPRCSASTAASDRRGSVLECSSPLELSDASRPAGKLQRTGAVQNATAPKATSGRRLPRGVKGATAKGRMEEGVPSSGWLVPGTHSGKLRGERDGPARRQSCAGAGGPETETMGRVKRRWALKMRRLSPKDGHHLDVVSHHLDVVSHHLGVVSHHLGVVSHHLDAVSHHLEAGE